jgi:hypothetical protein
MQGANSHSDSPAESERDKLVIKANLRKRCISSESRKGFFVFTGNQIETGSKAMDD